MHEIKTIDLGDVTLAYREYGTGDKYLLCTQNFFFKNSHMALLGQPPYDYHCFLVYMRGYGQSTHITDDVPRNYTKIWGQDLVRFAKAMGIESFYYTGVSHGNWAGCYTAFFHPEMLRAMVCCNGFAGYMPFDPARSPLRPPEDAEDLVGNRERLAKMAWMENWPTENPQRLARRAANYEEHLDILMHRQKEEFTLRNLLDMSVCEAKSQEEVDERLRNLHVPLMIWYGGKDRAAEMALRSCQLVPGASLLTYQHLGHGGADECPEIAARDCDRFFRDTEGRIL